MEDPKVATTITLVRHGEALRGLAGADAADPGLSPLGEAQARRAADRLALEPVGALYCSPLRRAAATAAVIGAAIGIDPAADADLAEFDRDAPRYIHFEDLARDDPSFLAFLRGDLSPWGVDAEDFVARVVGAIDRLADRHHDEHVIAVTHGGVINAYMGAALGLTELFFHQPGYTGLSRVRVGRSGRKLVVALNETAHVLGLPAELPEGSR